MGILRANNSGGPLLYRQAFSDNTRDFLGGGGGDGDGSDDDASVTGIIQGITEETHVVAEAINELSRAEAIQGIDDTIATVNEAIRGVSEVMSGVNSDTEAVSEAINVAVQSLHNLYGAIRHRAITGHYFRNEALSRVVPITSTNTAPIPEVIHEAFATVTEAIHNIASAVDGTYEAVSEAASEAAINLIFEGFEELDVRVNRLLSITPIQNVGTYVTDAAQLNIRVLDGDHNGLRVTLPRDDEEQNVIPEDGWGDPDTFVSRY